jgi:hypothetical protein
MLKAFPWKHNIAFFGGVIELKAFHNAGTVEPMPIA